MAQQIRRFLGNDEITVNSFWLENFSANQIPPIYADFALLSCLAAKETLAPYIHPSVPLIIANRTLSLDVIDQLIDLPAGSKALLVTKTKIGASEAAQTLSEIGLSHISVHSFFTDNIDLCTSISTVLLFDEPETIPSWATKVIDLGVREIELSSLVEIAFKLNEPLKTNIPVSIKYLQEITHRSQRMLQSTKLIDLLNRQLNVVLNKVTDCLIVVDANFTIRFLNDTAKDFFGAKTSNSVGQSLQTFSPELQDYLKREGLEAVEKKCVVTIAGRPYHVNSQTVNDVAGQQLSTVITLRNVDEVLRIESEVRQALRQRGHFAQYTFSDIIGNSSVIKSGIHIAKKLALSDLNILIYGENGTGKELFAHSIHNASSRDKEPFIAINCAALSPTLLESELFGYEEGAFTGAKKGGKSGLIEQANMGTLFLDEIGDITPEAQTKLLRVIQERALMRIGGARVIPVNIRIIAATNKVLQEMVEKGHFRQDLYFRLFVAPLTIPPLRDRLEDIPSLLHFFMRQNQIPDSYIDEDLLGCLYKYSWPGNIRELSSIVQYAGVICEDKDSFKMAMVSRIGNRKESPLAFPLDLQPSDLPVYLSLLTLFADAKQRGVRLGRKRLVAHMQLENPKMTEQTLRTRLSKLAKAGFVSSGVGRQGSQITAKGELFRSSFSK